MTLELAQKELDIPVSAGEDDVTQYLHEIRGYPRLTVQQERQLARRCADGDEDAIRQMVNSNLRLVVSVAKEYAGRGVPLLDLIQEGSIGLLAAAKKFDYTLDFRFSTYATKWIRQGVTRCLMNHSGLIRVPVYTLEQIRKVQSASAALMQQLHREATAEEIAEFCDTSTEKVKKLQQMMPEVCSLDAPAGDSDGGTLGLLLEDIRSSEPYDALVREELSHTMDELMGTLTERQRLVLQLHFGMEDGTCHSLEEIAGILGISKERVRQIEKQSMEKLQKIGAGMGLEDFLNE